ncbi:nicotinamide mononucleotide transporter [Candidatus Woesearchaeota archaeon]|nr:nicotinamide mononucleotide transporter [Candidatus Woesearchaeota archaeon]
MVLDLIAQIGIAIFGVSAIILVSLKNKWGFVLGFLSQPFFLLTSYLHKQWGLFILSWLYTGSWIFGIYSWFYKNKKSK